MKGGIYYFPFSALSDDRTELIEAEFGLTGFAVIVKLYQKIYGGFGYYCEWTNDVALLFGAKNFLGGDVVSEIVTAAIRRGIFDIDLYEKYKILTSKEIQEKYFEAVSRRKKLKVKKSYLLVQLGKNSKCEYIFDENDNIFEENVYSSEQRKEKENKEKKTKEKDVCLGGHRTHENKKNYGYFKNVFLSDEEFEALTTEFPHDYNMRIERLSEYMASSGRIYCNHFATIRLWASDEKLKNKDSSENAESYDDLEELTRKRIE